MDEMEKKTQIESFVIDVKRIIERHSKERSIKLGLFLVPWTKGEKQNDISFKIAQDAFELSRHVDVISPMVYHKMCGQGEKWVGAMTAYYKETVSCDVWPIVQSHDLEPGEFENVIRHTGEAGADGMLVLSFSGMKPAMWNGLKAFNKPLNLLGKNIVEQGNPPKNAIHYSFVKTFNEYYIRNEYTRKPMDAIGLSVDYGRIGIWEAPLQKCNAGQAYLFTGLFYRDNLKTGFMRTSAYGAGNTASMNICGQVPSNLSALT